MKTIKMEEMNSKDIQIAIEEGFKSIVIAVGSIEQHGPHLPIITDSEIGEAVAFSVAEKLGNFLMGPTIRFGCSDHHLAFKGTISMRDSTLQAVMFDYVSSLVKHGFENVVFLPSHGGNFATVQEAITQLQKKYPECKITGYTDLYEYVEKIQALSAEKEISSEESGAHAGENETSLMLVLKENLVKKDRFQAGYLGEFGKEQGEAVFKDGIIALSKIGVLGDPTKATKESGEYYLENFIEFITQKVKEMI